MNAHAFGSHPTIRAAVRAAESICTLPAVPTADWCGRAAKALVALRPPSIALVMLARLDDKGSLVRVETAGVAGCMLAEVSTTFGRVQSVSSIVPLAATHPALGSVRSGAHTCGELGWALSVLGPAGAGAVHGGALDRAAVGPGTAMHKRWGESGATDFLIGAAPLASAVPGRYVIAEIGLTGGQAGTTEEAAVLSNALPLLSRRIAVAFGDEEFNESACLTHREEVVLQHLLDGKSVRVIADEIDRSPHTVHDHVKSLHRKLKARSRGALVARALGHFVPPPVPRAARGEAAAQPSGQGVVSPQASPQPSPMITFRNDNGDAVPAR